MLWKPISVLFFIKPSPRTSTPPLHLSDWLLSLVHNLLLWFGALSPLASTVETYLAFLLSCLLLVITSSYCSQAHLSKSRSIYSFLLFKVLKSPLKSFCVLSSPVLELQPWLYTPLLIWPLLISPPSPLCNLHPVNGKIAPISCTHTCSLLLCDFVLGLKPWHDLLIFLHLPLLII